MLGAILNRCNAPDQKLLAKVLMLTASALGDASATMLILKSALQRGTIHSREHAPPMRHLLDLAASESNLQAMILLGKILGDQRENDEALKWFRKAAERGADAQNIDSGVISDALVYEGLLLQRERDRSGAKAVFQRAALELDNPLAYFHLAQLQDSGSSIEEGYLLKAAVSGVPEACHCLGMFYLNKRGEYAQQGSTWREQTALAKEWLRMSAEDGFMPSMVRLAGIHQEEGHLQDNKKWLERSKATSGTDEAVGPLK